MHTPLLLIPALILDLIFGDPKNFPHPVVLIGKMISAGEKGLRPLFPDTKRGQFLSGMLLSLLVCATSFLAPFALLYVLGLIHPYLRLAVEILFCWQILAAKSLKQESMKVYEALKEGDLQKARRFLSWLVSRQTQNLDEAGVIRGAVETVAENTCDAVIAPMFFIALLGAPLGFLYKAVSTLDSMIGYKTEEYFWFGKFAARMDDLFNFIPARLSGFLLILSAFLLRLDGRQALRIFLRDRNNHASPNSGQSEAACAGALGVQLGGDSVYFGKIAHKKNIGEPYNPLSPEHIKGTNRLMICAAVTFLTFLLLLLELIPYLIKELRL